MSTIPAHKEQRVIRKGGSKVIEKPAKKRKAKEEVKDESASQK